MASIKEEAGIRSWRSTLSRRRMSLVKARWKAVRSPLSWDTVSRASRGKELDGGGKRTHIAELDETQLAQGVNNLAADFVGDVELHHAHVRRAERGIPCRSHRGRWGVAMTTAMGMAMAVSRG